MPKNIDENIHSKHIIEQLKLNNEQLKNLVKFWEGFGSGVKEDLTKVAKSQMFNVERNEKNVGIRDKSLEGIIESGLQKYRLQQVEFKNKTDKIGNLQEFSKNIAAQKGSLLEKTVKSTFGGSEKQQKAGFNFVKGYYSTAEKVIKNLVEQGEDLSKIWDDEENLLKLRLKIAGDYISRKKITEEEQLTLEQSIIEQTKLDILQRQRGRMIREKAEQYYESGTKNVVSFISKIPGVGGALGQAFGKYSEQKKEKITTKIEAGLENNKGWATALEKISGILAKIGPIMIIVGAAVAFLIGRLMKLIGAEMDLTATIVKSLGVTKLQAEGFKDIAHNAQNALLDTQAFVNGLEEIEPMVHAAMSGLSKEYKNLSGITSQNIELSVSLAKRLGVDASQAAQYVYTLDKGLGFSGEKTVSLIKNLRLSSELAGVSFVDALKDVVENWERISLFVGKSEKAIISSVIQARLLGTTLESQERTARQFMSFEDAISNSFTLQLLTGSKINALQLYTQANYGDALSIQNNMLNILEKAYNTTKLSRYQQEALAKAVGMTHAEVQKLLRARAEEYRISKSLKDIGFEKKEEFTNQYLRAAVREIKTKKIEEFSQQGYKGKELEKVVSESMKKDIGKTGIEQKAKEIEKARIEASREITTVSAALGLTEAMSPTEKLQAKMVSSLDKMLQFFAGPLSTFFTAAIDSLGIIADWASSGLFGGENIGKMSDIQLIQKLVRSGVFNYGKGGEYVTTANTEKILKEDTDSQRYLNALYARQKLGRSAIISSINLKKYYSGYINENSEVQVSAIEQKFKKYIPKHDKSIEAAVSDDNVFQKWQNKRKTKQEKWELEKRAEGVQLNPFEKHALGGRVVRPGIVGETGPELVLPLTGPGVSMNKQVAKSYVSETSKNDFFDNKQINEMIILLKQVLTQKQATKVQLNLDSRKIAEALVERSLITS